MALLQVQRSTPSFVGKPGVVADNHDYFSPSVKPVAAANTTAVNDAKIPSPLDELETYAKGQQKRDEDNEKVVSRATALLEKLNPKPAAEPAAPSRSAALTTNMVNLSTTPPDPAKFEEINMALLERQAAFAERWAPVHQLVQDKSPNVSGNDLSGAIASVGSQADYDKDVDQIAILSNKSADEMQKLSEHISQYRGANGDNEHVVEAASRINDSLNALAQGPVLKSAKAAPKTDGAPKADENEVMHETGAPGAGKGQSESNALEDVMARLREMIKKMIELLQKIFSRNEPKPA